MKKWSWSASASAAAALLFSIALPVHAETKGPVTDDLGVVAIPKDAPIVIGGYWVISGPDTALGLDSKRGVEIAFDDIGNKIAGHAIQLVVEDDGCNAEGGQTAATKLATVPDIVAVLGPACSSAATAGAPILWKAGITNVGTATTAPSLTAADRKPDYFGYMRTIYSDADQGFNDAEYFYKELKCKTIATIHDGSPYASQLAKVAANQLDRTPGSRGPNGKTSCCRERGFAGGHRNLRDGTIVDHGGLLARRRPFERPIAGHKPATIGGTLPNILCVRGRRSYQNQAEYNQPALGR